jgi:hypothetical protein
MFGFLSNENVRFSEVPQAEDCEALETPVRTKSSPCSIPLLFITSVMVAALLGAWLGSRWSSNSNSGCVASASQYCRHPTKGPSSWWLTYLPAPVVRDVDMSYRMVRFNGSLLKENVFRQNAGPEVDAAWTALGVDCECLYARHDKVTDLIRK